MNNKEKILNDFIDSKLRSILDSYSEDSFDDILDERDEEYFSDVWMSIYTEVEALTKEKGVNPFSESIREKAFKLIINETDNSDLAAYISDDLGLLSDAVDVGYNNGWLISLWNEYQKNKIPSGKLKIHEGYLSDLFK
ncbi:hypothetical protein [Aquimarina muelleri]|uniref:Uncharacterized protein n=1 Tax=Aquimarina muelleri TaxID=279356 RepID=A0A918N602_9FLAO|nr:hypothetical protein [Aquimarina muelleri]MCX2765092.1 hypothetical protein [Aquimarina muelleri]GGX35355.1 hypothetical protein GCM10007384_39440 [Aquimarina muelleri]